jgi:hypothetical protein
MKLFTAHILLIDCGRASSRTRGQSSGVFSEGGSPPYTHWNG